MPTTDLATVTEAPSAEAVAEAVSAIQGVAERSALDLAVLADQFDAERAAGLVPGRTHPANLAAHHRNAIVSAVNAAVAWRTEKTTFITNEIDSMKGSVDATVAQNTRDVQDAGAAARPAAADV